MCSLSSYSVLLCSIYLFAYWFIDWLIFIFNMRQSHAMLLRLVLDSQASWCSLLLLRSQAGPMAPGSSLVVLPLAAIWLLEIVLRAPGRRTNNQSALSTGAAPLTVSPCPGGPVSPFHRQWGIDSVANYLLPVHTWSFPFPDSLSVHRQFPQNLNFKVLCSKLLPSTLVGPHPLPLLLVLFKAISQFRFLLHCTPLLVLKPISTIG